MESAVSTPLLDALHSLPVSLCISDLGGGFLYINKAFEIFFKVNLQQLRTTEQSKLLGEDFSNSAHAALQEVLQTADVSRRNIKWKSGASNRELSLYSFPLFNQDKEVYAVAILIRDVTDENKLRQEITQTDKMLASLFDNSSYFQLLLLPSGKILYANKSALDLINALPRQITGRHLTQTPWWEGNNYLPDLHKALLLAQSGQTAQFEAEFFLKEVYFIAQCCIKPISDNSGQVEFILAEGNDITELRITQQALQNLNEDLENRVKDQTRHLADTVVLLEKEVETRKNTERLLADREVRLKTIIEAAPVWINVAGSQGNILHINPAGIKMLGLSSEDEIIGSPVWDFLDTGCRKRMRHAHENALAGKSGAIEFNITKQDKESSHFSAVTVPLRDQQKTPFAALSIITDITEAKKANISLYKERNRLKVIASAINDVIFDHHILKNSFWWFSGTSTIFGYTEAEISCNPEQWVKFAHPKDKKEIKARLSEFMQSNGNQIELEYRFQHKQGHYIWIRLCINAQRDADGTIFRLFGGLQNINRRKKAEEEALTHKLHLQLINDNIQDMAMLLEVCGHKQFKVVSVNKAMKQVYGAEAGFLPKKFIHELISEPELNFWMNFYTDVVENHKTKVLKIKPRWVNLDRVFEVKLIPVISGNSDSCTHILVVMHDITPHIKTEEKLHDINNELTQTSEHLQEIREEERMYLSRELHDSLGQLLAAIKIDASLAYKVVQTGEQPDQLFKELLQGLDNAIAQIRQISSSLRPQELDKLSLEEALQTMLKNFEARFGIATNLSYSLSDLVLPHAYTTALYRICQESFTNIGRYAQATKAEIMISLKGNEVIARITDNGVGIGKGAPMRHGAIGITGMQERAAQLGGTVTVDALPGCGTLVKAILPLPEHNPDEEEENLRLRYSGLK